MKNNGLKHILIVRSCSLFLEEVNMSEVCKVINEKIKTHNAATCYYLSRLFFIPSLYKTTFSFIERWFPMVIETKNFLELEKSLVSKILASSGLQIDSEVEVYNAANQWLAHDIEERIKYAKQLLLKVRLNLLSEQCLKYLINDFSWISTNDDCLKVLKNRDIFYQNDSAIYNKSRHCNQNMFNILVCGGRGITENKSVNQVKEFHGNHLEELEDPPRMLNKRYCSTAVCFRGEAYVFGGIGFEGNRLKSVEKYSPVKKTWNHVFDLPDERQYFCASAFMRKIYIFGGHSLTYGSLNSCLEYDAETLIWNEVAEMRLTRSNAACAIYEGNIAVSGGIDHMHFDLRSVELYDAFVDNWTPMPSMIEERNHHSLVCVRSKMFAIGGAKLNTKSEVFDRISNKFVKLKTPNFLTFGMVSVLAATKIFVFQDFGKSAFCYDVDKNKWSEESCKASKKIRHYSLVKIPSSRLNYHL